jgi:hypothetical protein
MKYPEVQEVLDFASSIEKREISDHFEAIKIILAMHKDYKEAARAINLQSGEKLDEKMQDLINKVEAKEKELKELQEKYGSNEK